MRASAKLRELLDQGKVYARELFREDGVIDTTAIVTAGPDTFLLVRDVEDEHRERAVYLRDVSSCVLEERACGVCLVEEREPPRELDGARSRRDGPSDEGAAAGEVRTVLLVTVEDASGGALGAVAEVRRQGKVAELGGFRPLTAVELSRLAPRFFEVARSVWN